MTKPPTAGAILEKAAALLVSPLPHKWACCEYDLGPYCPRCAIAFAKGELTRDMSFTAGDDDLHWARICISAAEDALQVKHGDVLTKQQALTVIKFAAMKQALESKQP